MNHDNSFEYNPLHKECILNNMKIVSATAGIIFLPQLVQQKNQNFRTKPNAQEMGFLDHAISLGNTWLF